MYPILQVKSQSGPVPTYAVLSLTIMSCLHTGVPSLDTTQFEQELGI